MNKYNDQELLYLVYKGSEEALSILFNKYKPLIYKRIRSYKIKPEYVDDFLQEGLICLYNTTKIYDPKYNKTFTTFFDLVLQRRFKTLLEANKKRFYSEILYPSDDVLFEDAGTYSTPLSYALKEDEEVEGVDLKVLSKWEQKVFNLRYKESLSCSEIASVCSQDIKSVYNALFQIKKKLRSQVKR